MSIYNWGFNSFYINNNFMPMPYWGGCGCNSFNSGFRFGMFNSLFNYMMPQMNLFSLPQTFAMPLFNPYNNIFAMSAYTNPLFNFSVPSLFSQLNTLNNYTEKMVNTSRTQNFNTVATSSKTRASSDVTSKIDRNFKNESKLDKNFLNKVKDVAKNLNCDYKDLLAVMNSESGINPTAWNGNTAVGLIQFTDLSITELNRVHGLNLTKEKIANMPAMEQLDLVEKYLKIAKSYKFSSNARLSAADLYAITFLPGRADREVLCTKGERNSKGQLLNYYESNPLDKDGDNKITKSDLEKHLAGKRVNESIFV